MDTKRVEKFESNFFKDRKKTNQEKQNHDKRFNFA